MQLTWSRAVARCLFALGITRGMGQPEGKGQARASTPRGAPAGPGEGHGRASSEDTSALGEGPFLARWTLRGRHREVARRPGPVLPLC